MIEIRRAEPRMADELTRIAHAAKAHWGYPESQIASWRDELTLTAEFIRSNLVHVAVCAGEPVGTYALIGSGRRLELEHFWIDPRWVGQGLGRALFEHATYEAVGLGATTLEILSDPHAEGFYLRMGARRTGEKPAPVDDDPDRVLPRLLYDLWTL
jgi:GNAT superfamily N-acetyltransferase